MSSLPGGDSYGSKKQSVPPAVPLDLRCSGENGRPPAWSTQRGSAVTVSRRCAPPLVPINTAPSTSLPRARSSSIVTTMRVNRRHSTNNQSAAAPATVNVPRKRSRDLTSTPLSPSPAEKLSRASSDAVVHTSPMHQPGLMSPVCMKAVGPDDGPAAAAVNDGHLSDKPSATSSKTTSSQHPAAVVVSTVADEQAVSGNAVSLPVVLTSVNGMLVPLSSTPATIIVVNCATTASPPAPHSSSRLCPIAPAPPSVTRQSAPSTTASSAASQLCTDNDVATPSPPTAQRRTYNCEEPGCGKTYFKKSHLKVHRRVHTGLYIKLL